MKRIALLASLFAIGLLNAGNHHHHRNNIGYQDRDMDGVVDRYDRCPHTPFFALVNRHGCTIKRLNVSGKFRKVARQSLQKNR